MSHHTYFPTTDAHWDGTIPDKSVYKHQLGKIDKPDIALEDLDTDVDDPQERQVRINGWVMYLTLVVKLLTIFSSQDKAAAESLLESAQTRLDAVHKLYRQSTGCSVSRTPGATGTKENKPKPPPLTVCNVFGPNVEHYLKNVQLYLNNFTLTDDREVAMLYVNNLDDRSRSHLFNLHPVGTAFYSTSATVIAWLRTFTNEAEVKNRALASLRTLKMQGNKLTFYYTSYCKLLANSGWASTDDIAVKFFIEGLNSAALPTNLKLAVHELSEKSGVSVMDIYHAAEKKMQLVHGANYERNGSIVDKGNNASTGGKTSNAGGARHNREASSSKDSGGWATVKSRKQQANQAKLANKQQGREPCGRCGRRHLGGEAA